MADLLPEAEAPTGRGVAAMVLVLVGLLEFMSAGSKWLIGHFRGELEGWEVSVVVLCLIGLATFLLARGVWRMRPWVPVCTVALSLAVLGFGLYRLNHDAGLDLALALVFLLAMVANLGLLGWAHLPSTRRQWGEYEAGPGP